MDVLRQAQTLVTEHMFTIGISLLVALVLAGFAWFWMSRGSQKNPTLVNAAQVNEATTNPEEQLPSQEQLEEMAKYKAESENVPQEENSA